MTNLNINQIFIRCCSQVLCGIKPANLFTLSTEAFSEEVFAEWKTVTEFQGLSISAFNRSSNVVMIFVYDFLWIRKILEDSFTASYLKGKGYTNVQNTTKTLDELFVRLKKNEGFPHEVGILLGYPIEDVISFEEKEGKCCKYCGYWKSYCNPEEAKKCCQKYKQCSQMCKQWFDEGYSIPQIIKKYKKIVAQAA